MKPLIKLSTVFLILLTSLPLHASWLWMRDSAVTAFTDADWDILKATARDTLNTAEDGVQVNWKNEETGNKGAIKAIMTFSYAGLPCRRLALLNVNNKGVRGVANYNLCQQTDETWQFVADSTIAAQ